MAFIIEGNLYSQACTDCRYPLVHSKIRFYRAEVTREVFGEIAANTKDTVRIISPEEVKALDNFLAGEATLDANGHYSATLKRYEQGPLRIVAEIQAPDGKESKQGPAYVFLTTILPDWQYSKDQQTALYRWEYLIPKAFWCGLLEWFDLWVICGRVTICDQRNTPARKVKVRAMDADVITDDILGSTSTDANGNFQIYYHTLDFKRTFLSWLGINVETPFGKPIGPDVYFVIEMEDGTPLLTETRADGKREGRKDVGHCACFDLCVKLPTGPVDVTPIVEPIWNKIGSAFHISTFLNPQSFDNEGYAEEGGRKYAIYSEIALEGQVPDPTRADCPLYRFMIAQSSRQNNVPAAPEAEFNTPNAAIVGATVGAFDPGLYVDNAMLGTLYRYELAPALRYVSVKVTMSSADVDNAAGWVDVRIAAQRALNKRNTKLIADGLPGISSNLSDYNWSNDGNQLMRINTRSLSKGEQPVPAAGLVPGSEYPLANRYSIPVVAIRFESVDRATMAPRAGHGQTLNAMVVSNAPFHAAMIVKNGDGFTSDCISFKNEDVFLDYTLYHSQLGGMTLSVRDGGNHQLTWHTPPMGSNPSFDNVPRAGIVESHAMSLLTPRPDHTCVYIAQMDFYLLRHNGENSEPSHSLPKYFYYEV